MVVYHILDFDLFRRKPIVYSRNYEILQPLRIPEVKLVNKNKQWVVISLESQLGINNAKYKDSKIY